MSVSDTNEASVDVTNTCSVPGDAVAKIYIHLHYRSASRPVRQFEAFERIALQPGETKTLTFPLGTDQLYFGIRSREPGWLNLLNLTCGPEKIQPQVSALNS